MPRDDEKERISAALNVPVNDIEFFLVTDIGDQPQLHLIHKEIAFKLKKELDLKTLDTSIYAGGMGIHSFIRVLESCSTFIANID